MGFFVFCVHDAGATRGQYLALSKALLFSSYKVVFIIYRTVAEKLKTGSYVEPELFPEASVYFSDIVSFTKLASESSPMEVVTMLNDLYHMFDTTLAKFNVYKVCFFDTVNWSKWLNCP